MATEKEAGQSLQYSWMWGGFEIGDAIFAPYDQGGLRSYYRAMFNAMWNRQEFCILPTLHSSYSGLLAVSNPAGTTLRMASGAALVDGFLYMNDANIDSSLATAGYYRLVLRRDWNAKTVISQVLGPSTVNYPAALYYYPSPPYGIVDVPIAKIYSDGSTLTIIDERTFFRNLLAIQRLGGSADNYDQLGTTEYVVENLSFQVGALIPEAVSGSEDFPECYKIADPSTYGNNAIMFLIGYADSAPSATRLVATSGGGTAFGWAVDSFTNLDNIIWIAIGGVQTRDVVVKP